MKLNSNTTPNGKNNTDLKDTLSQLGGESWALYCLAGLGTQAAFNDVADAPTLAHLFETLEKRLETLHDTINTLEYSDVVTAVTPTPTGTDAQALLTLLLQMLKDWRNLISQEGNRMNSHAVEATLEQAVTLASSLALNSVTEIKGGDL